MNAKQMALFPDLPFTPRHRPKLTSAQCDLLSVLLLNGGPVSIKAPARKRLLRQLILDRLVEVVSLSPAVYRVTEPGIDLRRRYLEIMGRNHA